MSDTHLLQVLRPQLDDLQVQRSVQARAPDRGAARGGHPRRRPRGHQLLRQQLSRPGQPSRHRRGGPRGAAPLRLRHGLGALHLRHAGRCTRSWKRRSPASCGKDDAILYSSCWDANGGLFETILGDEDAVLSDELNHASIIDGVRLCKARRVRYRNGDMAELEKGLQETQDCRLRLIATDGVFSMDGIAGEAAGDLRPGRPLRRRRDGGRQPRHRHPRPDRPRHAGAFRRAGPRSTSSPARWARRWAARRAASPARGPRWSTCCVSARGRISSPTPCRRRSCMAALKALELVGQSSDLRDRLHANAAPAAIRPGEGGLHDQAGQPSDPAGDARRRRPGHTHGRQAAGARHLRHRLQLSRWCRRGRRASASRCRRRTRRSSWTGRSKRSRRSARSWA